jgi:hypothetical protein
MAIADNILRATTAFDALAVPSSGVMTADCRVRSAIFLGNGAIDASSGDYCSVETHNFNSRREHLSTDNREIWAIVMILS